jgi:predicted flap endonuclease-1-like 5' DNA nuclease
VDAVQGAMVAAVQGARDELAAKIDALPLPEVAERVGTAESTLVERLGALGDASERGRRELSAQVEALLAVADLGPLRAELGVLERKVDGIVVPPVDLEPVSAQISALESKLGSRLDTLARSGRTEGLDELRAAVAAVDAQVARLDRWAPVEARLEALEGRIGAGGGAPAVEVEARSIAELTRPGTPNLLESPAFGPPDDLQRIKGVGKKLGALLQSLGVFYFWQIAEWTAEDVAVVDARLESFEGRIERDRWVEQCRALAAEPGAARRPA